MLFYHYQVRFPTRSERQFRTGASSFSDPSFYLYKTHILLEINGIFMYIAYNEAVSYDVPDKNSF